MQEPILSQRLSGLRLQRPSLRAGLIGASVAVVIALTVAIVGPIWSVRTGGGDVDEALITELLDQTNAALLVSADDLTVPIVLTAEEIDTSLDRRAILATLFERLTEHEADDIMKRTT